MGDAELVEDEGLPVSVGERLRGAREAAGLSLEDIATSTRIPTRHLESLETSDFSRLPAPTYTIGFAKSYAAAVGLDRADPRLAERYDWLSPAILRFLRRVVREADAAGVPVRVCGEMGGRPLEAMALIGIGLNSFSITPAAIGPVKAMVRSLDAGAVRARMDKLLAKPPRDMRKVLHDWAKRHRVALG